jgi:IS5 family transposase
MGQLTFAQQSEFQRYGKKTRREHFLDEMEAVMPWSELVALVAPHYCKGETGRKPVGLEIMLRVYFVQQWFALSDPGVEDALYESPVLRRFVGIDLGRAPAPDETTILNFRHLLEQHQLCGEMLDMVNHYLDSRGIRITTGAIVDATIIHAPSSTKNSKKERDPAMHQTKKGNQWYFGMKAHIGVDSKEGIVHSVCSTAASVSDVHMLPELLHGGEKKVWGDAGYQGQTEAIHAAAPEAQDMTSRRVKTKAGVDEAEKRKNRTKARVRAKVEWPFRIVKRVFGFTKVRYRGLKKNHEWLCAAFALANLYKNRKRLAKVNLQLAPQPTPPQAPLRTLTRAGARPGMQHRLPLRQWRMLAGTGGCAESVRCRAASLAISITAGTNAKYFTCGERR